MTEIVKSENRKRIGIPDYCFLAVLALFPFLHVNSGLDAADVGYNLLNIHGNSSYYIVLRMTTHPNPITVL